MSILIKDMKMPDKCGHCRFANAFDCAVTGNFISTHSIRQPDCPLTDVPPHGRLGDLDRLEQMFADIDNAPYSGFDGTEPFYSAEDAAQIIRLAPTIIESEE